MHNWTLFILAAYQNMNLITDFPNLPSNDFNPVICNNHVNAHSRAYKKHTNSESYKV